MHASSTPARLCPTCDGFPVVAVTTSTRRRPDGTLPTLHTACPDCHGTGTRTTPRTTRVLASR